MMSLTDYIKQDLSHPDHNQMIEMLLSLVGNDEKHYQLNPPFNTSAYGKLLGDIFFPEGIAVLDVNCKSLRVFDPQDSNQLAINLFSIGNYKPTTT